MAKKDKKLESITKKAKDQRTPAEKKYLQQAKVNAGFSANSKPGLKAIQAGNKNKEGKVVSQGVKDASKNSTKTASALAARADQNLKSRGIRLGAMKGSAKVTFDANGKPMLGAGEIAWGGRVYTRDNLGDLKAELNKRGKKLGDVLASHPGMASQLLLTESEMKTIRNRSSNLNRARRQNVAARRNNK